MSTLNTNSVQIITKNDSISITKPITHIINTGKEFAVTLSNNSILDQTKYITVSSGSPIIDCSPSNQVSLIFNNSFGNQEIIKFGCTGDIIVLFSTENGWRKVYTYIYNIEHEF